MAKTYWITGYSGAGKTTVGRELIHRLKQNNLACVFLDGDELRAVFGDNLGYTKEERYKYAMRYARLCKFLTSQNIYAVCCTVSMFNEVRAWNRDNIQHYVEVYLKVSPDILKQRDQKCLYSKYLQGVESNVVGLDLQMEEPQNPDIVIENDGSITSAAAALMILKGESYYA